ncbi:MAG: quinol:cytochrome C oxidoreductase, partial [Bacteroidia bacterium]
LISILAWLFIMSVDAHWYSTIFGVYNFATSWVSAIAFIALILMYVKSQGYLSIANKEHQHDLGKFMFAFTVFWAYIWLFQYLL